MSTGQVESAIASLLVQTVAGAQPVEGSGGDDGADVTAPLEGGGLHVFEIKSFTARLASGQKTKIKNSFATARMKRPTTRRWTLVLPKNLTPAEQRWLRGLGTGTGIVVSWMGLTELNNGFAANPHLARAHLPGSAQAQALKLLSDLGHEQAPLAAGVPDAIDRGQKLRELLSDVDPDYDFDLDLEKDGTTVSFRPRPGATPIRGSMSFIAPTGTPEADAIEEFYKYGSPLELSAENIEFATIELPGGLNALLQDAEATSVKIGPAVIESGRCPLLARKGTTVVARLTLTLSNVSQGPSGGGRVVLHDDSGSLELTFLLEPESQAGSVQFGLRPTGKPASDVLPAAELLQALPGIDLLTVQLPGGGDPVKVRLPDGQNMPGVDMLVHYLRSLIVLGDALGTSLEVPEGFPSDGGRSLQMATALLQGQSVPWPFPGMYASMTPEAARQLLATGPLPRVTLTGKGTRVAVSLPGGTVAVDLEYEAHCRDLLVVNAPALGAWLETGPGPADTMRLEAEQDGLSRVTFRPMSAPSERPARSHTRAAHD